MRGVGGLLPWQEQNLTILTEFLLIQREGGKTSKPEGQIESDKEDLMSNRVNRYEHQ